MNFIQAPLASLATITPNPGSLRTLNFPSITAPGPQHHHCPDAGLSSLSLQDRHLFTLRPPSTSCSAWRTVGDYLMFVEVGPSSEHSPLSTRKMSQACSFLIQKSFSLQR